MSAFDGGAAGRGLPRAAHPAGAVEHVTSHAGRDDGE
ncbi:hypothetical protein HNP84_006049 [Thermocatellispora tengchongensis]|uniref:Uncharacterized protein n=1 Tax=Thermocatellispora tengchongensis TaxID=1073253 RepID=A0A840PAL3_9ACTN|nr:hypothetical protein [Thermocatellispora tengchongensis]